MALQNRGRQDATLTNLFHVTNLE